MTTQQESERIMMAFVTAPSYEAAKSLARQYPILMDPGALRLLDRMQTAAQQSGQMSVYNQLNTARQRLAQIQAGG